MSTMKTQLLVGNISMDADEITIRDLFVGTQGVVTSISLPLDPKTGKNRGYALVEMSSDLEAEQAVRDLSGTSIEGRAMSISLVARAQAKRKWYKFGAR